MPTLKNFAPNFSRLFKSSRFKSAALVVVFLTAGGFIFNPNDHYFEISKNIDIFGKIIREVNANYVDDVEPNEFVRVGIDAMLASLDPYTNYISASEIEDFRYLSTGQYGGIGASLSKQKDKIVITEVYEGKPADKAGVKPGDEVIQIDNELIKGKSYENTDVRNLLRGTANSKVKIKVMRHGKPEPLELEITRDDIKIDNVPYYGMIDAEIGYIALKNFTRDAGKEVHDALNELKSKNPGLKGVVLDLKGNPGGLLHEAINISNVFVNKGEKIVETKGKMEGSYKLYSAEMNALDTDIPLAVVINKGSASASEIVSGVMQDLDRGVVVGQRSYGKGLVQTTRDLSYKTKIKITTARYYTPSGRCIQAIDYSHKGKDGAAKRTADSLKQEFKTRAGRSVRDQGGIEPDIKVKEMEYHKVTGDLVKENLIFDFATEYYYKHPTLPVVKDFKITDEIYNDFVKFVEGRDFKYESKYDKKIEELNKELESEAYYATVKSDLDDLKKQIDNQRKNDIIAHRAEIAALLRAEIASRYNYKSGRIEASFQDDPDLKAAVEVLKDPKRYKSILTGK